MPIRKIDVYHVCIEDKPRSLHCFFDEAALSNIDFQCFAAFSGSDNRGHLYITAKDNVSLESFLSNDLSKTIQKRIGFIFDGPDKIRTAADVTKGLAEADINGVAAAGIAYGGQYQMMIVVDHEDGDKAAKVLGL